MVSHVKTEVHLAKLLLISTSSIVDDDLDTPIVAMDMEANIK